MPENRQDEFPVQAAEESYPRPEWTYPDAVIGTTYADSRPDFPPPLSAPAGAPNVLLVLLDDVGFGWSSAFGGLVRMPVAERMAASGLMYNQFHTTALCSPTRAALLTGRNHHTAHTGNVGELATGFPGYDGIIPRSCGTVAKVLSANGYATGWFGKNHNVPDNMTSDAGPFSNWPTQLGFDYFYGFIAGETDQFFPALYRGTTPVPIPATPEEGYQLTRDLADDCIGWVRRQKSIAPDRPVFTYFAPGAGHAPHQPPLDWRGRNAGRFDMGWDAYREQVWQQQLEAGIIPEGTMLTPRPAEIPAWDDHTDEQKRLLARQAENFADFLEHADYEVGRVVDAFEQLGELDNTLVIYIVGDNGSSAEGTLTGLLNEMYGMDGNAGDFSPAASSHRPHRTARNRAALRRRLGVGGRCAVPVDQADRVALRRDAQRDARVVAVANSGCRRHPSPVPSRDRHHADPARGRRHRGARLDRRGAAEADRGGEPGLHVREWNPR